MDDEDDGLGLGWVSTIAKIFGFVVGFSIVIIILGAIFGPSKYEGQTGQVEEANTRIEDANSNIDDINSKIDDAQYCSYGGCDFEEMQSKISDLEKAETIEPVDEP